MSRRWSRRAGRSGLGGASSFSPLSLSPVLWLRSDMGITLNGSNVSAWADQSGRGDANRNLSQPTVSAQPPYVASDAGIGGLPSIGTWDGVDDQLPAAGAWSTAPPTTGSLFVVWKSGGIGGVNSPVCGTGNRWQLYHDTTADQIRFYLGADVGVSAGGLLTSWNMTSLDLNGASSRFYVNSNTKTGADVDIGVYAGTTELNVGRAAYMLGSYVAEVILYSSVLSAGNRAQVSSYISSRYGITIT